jgi:amino acid permease
MHGFKDSTANNKVVADLGDVEKNGHESSNENNIPEPQLNVGGHGGTQRRLKDYQVTMIGFCSGIGTGLFIGTGSAYATAGPAGLLLAYIVVGAVLWAVMQSIAELATLVSITFLSNCKPLFKQISYAEDKLPC